MAATSSAASGSVAGPKRARTAPSFPITNFAKFQAMSPGPSGWLDWLEEGSVVVVEWGDRFPRALPRDHLEVRLSGADAGRPEQRTLEVRAGGPLSRAALACWRGPRP